MLDKLFRRVASGLEAIQDWSYTPLYRRGWVTIRRVDPIIALTFTICVVYYYIQGGWQLALIGAGLYTMIAMICLWFF